MKKVITNIETLAAMSLVVISVIAVKFMVYAPEVTTEIMSVMKA